MGGSIRVAALPSSIKEILDAEMAAGSSFILGDAEGVDVEVQRHLNARNYRDVTIYTMDRSRANVGQWTVKNHKAPAGVRGGAYYAVKDREMDRASDAGIMIWDGSSSGTRNNIVALLGAGKPCVVHDGKTLRTYENLEKFELREGLAKIVAETPDLFDEFMIQRKAYSGLGDVAMEKDALGISGLTIIRNWLPQQGRTGMLAIIDSRPWSNALKRRTQHEGWKYSYDRRPLRDDDYLGPLPSYLETAVARLRAEIPHLADVGEQAIVNNYERGEGIGTHIDHVGNFGPAVVSLSLVSGATIRFARAGKVVDVDLQPGDLCVMEGDARFKWTHAIEGHQARRVSVTFRSIADRELAKKMMGDKKMAEKTSFNEIGGDIWEQMPVFDAICVTTNGIRKSDGTAVMGAGIAKSARDKFPGIDKKLGELLEKNGNHVQVMWETSEGKKIIAFPTKNDWREDSDPELIRRSCKELVALTNQLGIRAVMTRPGTANGKLDWERIVKPILNAELAGSNVTVVDMSHKTDATIAEEMTTPSTSPAIQAVEKIREQVKENRARGNTPTLPSPETAHNPGWLLPHITGKNDLSIEISRIGDDLKKIDPATCGIKDVEAYHKTRFVTVVGSRKIADDPEKMMWMEWTARTFAESGFVIRSGGAEGADMAAEVGAKASKVGTAALEIAHPYDRPSKGSRDPGNYVLREGPLKKLAHEFIRGVTHNFDSVSDPARDLQGRDFVQVYGKDGQTPSAAVFYCAPEPEKKMYDKDARKGEIESGTRFAVYSARAAEALGFDSIPDHNLEIDREAYRSAVISLANEQRAEMGKKPLPEDWSPNHESYLKVTGRDPESVSMREAETANRMADELKEKEEASQAQAAARRLMIQMKILLANEGDGPQFKALEDRVIQGEIAGVDGQVLAIKDLNRPGEYTFADLGKTRVQGKYQVGSVVKLLRDKNGVMQMNVQEMQMSQGRTMEKSR